MDSEPDFQYIPEKSPQDPTQLDQHALRDSMVTLKEGLSSGAMLAQFDVRRKTKPSCLYVHTETHSWPVFRFESVDCDIFITLKPPFYVLSVKINVKYKNTQSLSMQAQKGAFSYIWAVREIAGICQCWIKNVLCCFSLAATVQEKAGDDHAVCQITSERFQKSLQRHLSLYVTTLTASVSSVGLCVQI